MALTWRVFRTEARRRMALVPSQLWNAEDRWCWEVWDGEAPPPRMFHGQYASADDQRLVKRGYAFTKRKAEAKGGQCRSALCGSDGAVTESKDGLTSSNRSTA